MTGPLIIKVKKATWRKVEQIVSIAESWVKADLAPEIELRMLKARIWDFSAAQIDKLLSDMLAVDKGLKKIGGN